VTALGKIFHLALLRYQACLLGARPLWNHGGQIILAYSHCDTHLRGSISNS